MRSRLIALGALVSSPLPSAALAQGDAAVAPPGQPGQQEQSDEPPPLTSKPAPRIPDVRKPHVPQQVDDEAPVIKPSPVYQPIASPVVDAADTSYSGQIILADIGALFVGRLLVGPSGSNLPILLGWSLASPVVHGIHGHPGRAGVSLLLHTGLPIIGGLLGYAASNCSSSQDEEVPVSYWVWCSQREA